MSNNGPSTMTCSKCGKTIAYEPDSKNSVFNAESWMKIHNCKPEWHFTEPEMDEKYAIIVDPAKCSTS